MMFDKWKSSGLEHSFTLELILKELGKLFEELKRDNQSLRAEVALLRSKNESKPTSSTDI